MEFLHQIFCYGALGYPVSFYKLIGYPESTLALIMCGFRSSLSGSLNFGFGGTTSGEHHVTGFPSGTSSNISSYKHYSSLFLSGSCRLYACGLGFLSYLSCPWFHADL